MGGLFDNPVSSWLDDRRDDLVDSWDNMLPGEDILLSEVQSNRLMSDKNLKSTLVQTMSNISINEKSHMHSFTEQASIHSLHGGFTNLLKYYNRGKNTYSNGLVDVIIGSSINDFIPISAKDAVINKIHGYEPNISIKTFTKSKLRAEYLVINDTLVEDINGVRIERSITYENGKPIFSVDHIINAYTDDPEHHATEYDIVDIVWKDNRYVTVLFKNGDTTDSWDYTDPNEVIDKTKDYFIFEYTDKEYVTDDLRYTYFRADSNIAVTNKWLEASKRLKSFTAFPVVPILVDNKYLSNSISPNWKDENSSHVNSDDPNGRINPNYPLDFTNDCRNQLNLIGLNIDELSKNIVENTKIPMRKIKDDFLDEVNADELKDKKMSIVNMVDNDNTIVLNKYNQKLYDDIIGKLEDLPDYDKTKKALDGTQDIFVTIGLDFFSDNNIIKRALFLTFKKLKESGHNNFKFTEDKYSKALKFKKIDYYDSNTDTKNKKCEYNIRTEKIKEHKNPYDEESYIPLDKVKIIIEKKLNSVVISSLTIYELEIITVVRKGNLYNGHKIEMWRVKNTTGDINIDLKYYKNRISIPLIYEIYEEFDNYDADILAMGSLTIEIYVAEIGHLFWYQTEGWALFFKLLTFVIVFLELAFGRPDLAALTVKAYIITTALNIALTILIDSTDNEQLQNIYKGLYVAASVYVATQGNFEISTATDVLSVSSATYSSYNTAQQVSEAKEYKQLMEEINRADDEAIEVQKRLDKLNADNINSVTSEEILESEKDDTKIEIIEFPDDFLRRTTDMYHFIGASLNLEMGDKLTIK